MVANYANQSKKYSSLFDNLSLAISAKSIKYQTYSWAWLIQVWTRNIKLKRKFGIDPNRSEYNNHSDFDMWLHVDTDLGLVQMNKKCPLKVKYIATFHMLCQVCQCVVRKKKVIYVTCTTLCSTPRRSGLVQVIYFQKIFSYRLIIMRSS